MSFGFAHLVLAAWLPIGLAFFFFLRPTAAGVAVMVAGMLFLPESAFFDGPGIPPIGKQQVTELAVLLGLLFFAPKRLRKARPLRGMDWFVLVLMVSGIGTVLTNREALFNGPTIRQALSPHDIASMAIGDALEILVPFVLGRALVDSARDAKTMIRIVVGFGLAYSLFMLVEMRMSPQLHRWVYGYHAHEFVQTMRWGGFRPTVFMTHGLAVAMFALVAALLAATKVRLARGGLAWGVFLYLTLILVLCKSTGAIVVGLVVLPVALFVRPRRQLRLAALLAAICFAYPNAKMSGLFPEDTIMRIAESIGHDRAQSLLFRFENDRQLVERAQKKLWFGWGGFARNHIVTDWGQDISVTDGEWILRFGQRGLIGFFCAFGLLLLPVFFALRAFRKVDGKEERILLAGLSLVVACYGFDLLPNSLFTNIPYLFSGALLRLSKALPIAARAEARAAAEAQAGPEFQG